MHGAATMNAVTLRQRLDPRLHLAAAIGWAVFVVVTLAGLAAAHLAAAEAEHRARRDAEGLLAEFATQVRDALSLNLESRRSVLQATAAQILASGDGQAMDIEHRFMALQSQFPEFAWLAAVDSTGRVRAGTSAMPAGTDVSATPWFREGRVRPFVGESGAVRPSAAPVQVADRTTGPALLGFAVPLDPSRPVHGGVLAAQVPWTWVERVVSRMQDALSRRRQMEILLAGRDGTVLAGPSAWLGVRPVAGHDLTEGGTYSIGTRTQLRLADGLGLGWTAVVRQRADIALEPVRTIRRSVFSIVFLAGLLSAGCAAMVARVFTRRLSWLARDAEAVRTGRVPALHPPKGVDEVSRIGSTLAQLVDHLQAEKQSLQVLNAELDRRVAERTLRIERMGDEARHAAVTRERLHIARELHDTLAHSMVALLTQVRLVRKLRDRMSPAELGAELERAEVVAATGLAEARAAITQMRDNGVHDTGLGRALDDLARRFVQRTGVQCGLTADPGMAVWADDRAETVFRIVEEALRNVERHARARSVRVHLCVDEGAMGQRPGEGRRVMVEVVDDGIGFDPARPAPGHYGLRGMQEQAALIAAQWEIASRPGHGTRVSLRMTE